MNIISCMISGCHSVHNFNETLTFVFNFFISIMRIFTKTPTVYFFIPKHSRMQCLILKMFLFIAMFLKMCVRVGKYLIFNKVFINLVCRENFHDFLACRQPKKFEKHWIRASNFLFMFIDRISDQCCCLIFSLPK